MRVIMCLLNSVRFTIFGYWTISLAEVTILIFWAPPLATYEDIVEDAVSDSFIEETIESIGAPTPEIASSCEGTNPATILP